jgi:hypothetical protein
VVDDVAPVVDIAAHRGARALGVAGDDPLDRP